MSLVSRLATATPKLPCACCDAWLFESLSETAAHERNDGSDVVFRVDFLAHQCPRCVSLAVDNCSGFFLPKSWQAKRSLPVKKSTYWTAHEFELMRKAAGCGFHGDAPAKVQNSNIFLATYRLTGVNRGDMVHLARNQLFPYIAALVCTERSRVHRCFECFSSPQSEGDLLHVGPVQVPCAATVVEKFEDEEAVAFVDLPPGVAVGLAGVQAKLDPDCPDAGPIALKYLPAIEERLFYLSSIANVDRAVKGRIEDPHVPVTMSDQDRRDLEVVVDKLVEYFKNDSKKYKQIVTSMLFGDFKSKKWTLVRAAKTVERLRQRYNPRYVFSGSIKLEPSKNNKPPRLLIADGDEGQVMAWLLLASLEKWVVVRFRDRTIKGLPKAQAIDRMIQTLTQRVGGPTSEVVRTEVIENDGSAWDACMSADLRDQIENRLMDTAAAMLTDFVSPDFPSTFTDARVMSNKMKTINIRVECKAAKYGHRGTNTDEMTSRGKSYRRALRAIRRSGCRGTSILNWISNLICWAYALAGAEGAGLVVPNGQLVMCRDGNKRYVKSCFEGDDSILSLRGKNGVGVTPEFLEQVRTAWVEMGHRPKLFLRDSGSVAEFCGALVSVGDMGLTEEWAPDLLRTITNASYVHNNQAITAAVNGDKKAFASATCPGLISRAYTLARSFPSVAREFMNVAASLGSCHGLEYSVNDRILLGLEFDDLLPHVWEADRQDIETKVCTLDYEDMKTRTERAINSSMVLNRDNEAALATRLGVVSCPDKWTQFLDTMETWRFHADENLWQGLMAGARA